MYAPPKDTSIPTMQKPDELKQYDAILFGIPTRYGNFPAQWKTFIDASGGLWHTGGLFGKVCKSPTLSCIPKRHD